MRLPVVAFVVLTAVLFSCKHEKGDKLLGSWQGTKLENPDMDSFFVESQRYIDTIGKGNSDITNWQIYGVTNMDSLRKVLQVQHDSARAMQSAAVLNTIFTFKKDSVVVISFNGSMDTSKWYMQNDNALVLEEMTGDEKGTKTKMDILTLTDKELKLKFEQDSAISTVTFRKGQK